MVPEIKHKAVNDLALNIFNWSLDALLEFVNEKLHEENGEHPGESCYHWTLSGLMQYAYAAYIQEIQQYSDDTIEALLKTKEESL